MVRRLDWIAWVLWTLVVMCPAAPAHAQIYKCPDASGKVTYQQTPCEANSTKGKIKIEAPAPSLGDKPPEARIVDQCLKLHEFSPTSPVDFVSSDAIYAPASDGSWLLAISGTAGKVGSRAPATVRCPVVGNGAINLDLWRAQATLGSIQRERRAEQAAATKATAATAASTPAQDSKRIGNEEKAGERRFIEASIRSSRLGENQIRQRLGDPDSYGTTTGTCLLPVSNTPYACKLSTWIYLPTEQDQQMRTTITFSQDGEAIDVTRAIQY